jgi:hypothetical protein
VGKPSWRAVSITAWCTAAVGAVLMLVSTFLSNGLVAAGAGLLLVAVAAAAFAVCLLQG